MPCLMSAVKYIISPLLIRNAYDSLVTPAWQAGNMNIELRQLRYFVAVAEEMHLGRAAARLHMTLPPQSQTIQAMEASLGAALFHRSRRNVAFTAAGIALLPQAQRLLSEAGARPGRARRAA